jgi:membrane-associated protein
LIGYLAGGSYKVVEKYVGRGAAILAALAVITLLILWRVRRSRDERVLEEEYGATHDAASETRPDGT